MTKRITFTTPDNIAPLPVVGRVIVDAAGDLCIVLQKGDITVQIGYICSDFGKLYLYNLAADKAAALGLAVDRAGKIATSD